MPGSAVHCLEVPTEPQSPTTCLIRSSVHVHLHHAVRWVSTEYVLRNLLILPVVAYSRTSCALLVQPYLPTDVPMSRLTL